MTEEPTRDELAAEWLPQVERWIKGYVAKKPEWSHHYYDFLSDATIKLMERIDIFLAEGEEFGTHFSCGLRITIMNDISSFLRYHYVRAARFRLLIDNSVDPGFELQDDDEGGFSRYLKHNLQQGMQLAVYDPCYQDETTEQLIFQACRDENDAAIVQSRIDGVKTKDIAMSLGVSSETVRKRLKRILKRYDRATS